MAEGARGAGLRRARRLRRVRAARRAGARGRSSGSGCRPRRRSPSPRARSPGSTCMVNRTGYTGEEGVELLVMAEEAAALWDAVLERGATPCGLGARDTLRLEVCYPLHGNDIGPETDAISAGLGWVCALDKDFTGAEELRRIKEAGPGAPARRLRDGGEGRPAPGHADRSRAARSPPGTHSPMLDRGIGMGYVPAALAEPGTELTIDVRGKPPRAGRQEADLQARGALTWRPRESYPEDLKYHPEHDWARIEGDEATLGITWYAQDALGELVHYEPPDVGATLSKDGAVRRGRVGQGGLRPDRAALRRGARGQPEGRRRARDGERGSVRRGLARAHPAVRPVRGRRAAGRRGVQAALVLTPSSERAQRTSR